jgi:hypothetical protein
MMVEKIWVFTSSPDGPYGVRDGKNNFYIQFRQNILVTRYPVQDLEEWPFEEGDLYEVAKKFGWGRRELDLVLFYLGNKVEWQHYADLRKSRDENEMWNPDYKLTDANRRQFRDEGLEFLETNPMERLVRGMMKFEQFVKGLFFKGEAREALPEPTFEQLKSSVEQGTSQTVKQEEPNREDAVAEAVREVFRKE